MTHMDNGTKALVLVIVVFGIVAVFWVLAAVLGSIDTSQMFP